MNDTMFSGFPVLNILPGSPAEKAGLRVGDRILVANGVRVESMEAYVEARNLSSTGVELTVQRGNRIFDTKVIFEAEG